MPKHKDLGQFRTARKGNRVRFENVAGLEDWKFTLSLSLDELRVEAPAGRPLNREDLIAIPLGTLSASVFALYGDEMLDQFAERHKHLAVSRPTGGSARFDAALAAIYSAAVASTLPPAAAVARTFGMSAKWGELRVGEARRRGLIQRVAVERRRG